MPECFLLKDHLSWLSLSSLSFCPGLRREGDGGGGGGADVEAGWAVFGESQVIYREEHWTPRPLCLRLCVLFLLTWPIRTPSGGWPPSRHCSKHWWIHPLQSEASLLLTYHSITNLESAPGVTNQNEIMYSHMILSFKPITTFLSLFHLCCHSPSIWYSCWRRS